MSYRLTLYGHGPEPDDVREIFETTVRALRAVTPEGSPPVDGDMTAGNTGTDGVNLRAADVVELEAVDAVGDDEEATSDPAADDVADDPAASEGETT